MDRSHPYIRSGFIMTHVANPIMIRLGRSTTLTVRGRRSGQLRTVPLGGPFVHAGRRYLVSGRGETHWARNLRAAGCGELRSHGATLQFQAVEVLGPERDEVVAAYRAELGARVDAYFSRIPDPVDHPTFRIEPIVATADGEPLAAVPPTGPDRR